MLIIWLNLGNKIVFQKELTQNTILKNGILAYTTT